MINLKKKAFAKIITKLIEIKYNNQNNITVISNIIQL